MPKLPGVTSFLTILDSDQAEFFDLVPLLLVVVDKAGNIMRVNRTFEETVNYNRHEICSASVGLSRFVVMEDIIKFIRAFDETTHPSDPSFRFRSKGGGETTCHLAKWQVRHGRSFLIFARE